MLMCRMVMNAVQVAFNVQEKGSKMPVRCQQIQCHTVFDIQMDTFVNEARLSVGGHTTDPPKAATHASAVARDMVRIALTLAALNDLEIKILDVKNACMSAPCIKKIWTAVEPEFRMNAGKPAAIV